MVCLWRVCLTLVCLDFGGCWLCCCGRLGLAFCGCEGGVVLRSVLVCVGLVGYTLCG